MSETAAAGNRRASLEKRQALARALLGNGRRPPPEQIAPIQPREEAGPAPLSFSQERLWFLDRWNPGSSYYNVPIGLRLRGPLNAGALEATLDAIIERHEVLRSTFPLINGQPCQVVGPASRAGLPVVDLSALPVDAREREVEQLALAEASRPFDLASGPVLRRALLRLGPEEHVLLLTLHHIVTDGWSRGVLAREVTALYGAFSRGEANPLSPLPLQYADFATWQRRRLDGEALERQLAYWRSHLQGAPSVLDLPADRPRPPAMSYRGAWLGRTFPAALAEGLAELSRSGGATLFMTLLAAFQVLLYRYSGQDDIVIGTPIANRTRAELEGLIGFFTNTLALRTDLSGDPTFRELLARVRETALGAYTHQDLPFEKLVEELQPERSPSHTPIFQALFMLQPPQSGAAGLPGLSIEPVEVDRSVARMDLVLILEQGAAGLDAHVEYSTDLFDRRRMERLLGHYRTLLEAILFDPDQRISRLPLLTPTERQQLLVGQNDTAFDHPSDRCAHELFEAQAARTPAAIAVEHDGEMLTYAELDRRAEELAAFLRERGVGPDDRVGLCADRSPAMMVGLLGILKAGGAYVPIDPSFPSQRVAFMLRDAGAALVLAGGEPAGALADTDVPIVRLDEARADRSRERRRGRVDPDCAVYVIYTSGSTGLPKGVVMSHRAIVNMLAWQRRTVPGAARTLQFASIGFDVSFQETFGAWCSGGTLVLLNEEVRRDPIALLRLMERARVERLYVPVAMFQQLALAAAAGEAVPGALREVITAGEQLQVTEEMVAFFRKTDGAALYNHYGPTETHAATGFEMRGDPAGWPALPPIGWPLDNAQVYLLDRNLEPVPAGVPGELYVGGAGLARGYLSRPEMTAERFIPDPHSPVPGARLYRTGDLARYLEDGTIEFLGRLDHQVKIRGFRIEIGEIESLLSQHPGVKEAVVMAREDTPGEKRLAAYVVPADGALSTGELREALREKLPGYMIPAAFVVLAALPLNANGKVNRRALPAPETTDAEEEAGYAGPRTPLEEGLAQIWSEVLGRERVGIHDGFFDLGGHSLLATRVAFLARERLRLEMPLRALFESPTVAGLAQALAGDSPAGNHSASLRAGAEIRPTDRDRPLPLSFAQQRLWFMDQLEAGSSLFNLPMAVRLSGPLDIAALEYALEQVQRRHEVLRTVFVVRDREPVQVINEPGPVPVPVVDFEAMPAEQQSAEVERLIAEEAAAPFGLERGPVFRCRLLRLAPDEHVLLLTMHHIATDFQSLSILWRELSAFYREAMGGKAASLSDLPIQYADYAAWQRARFDAGAFASQLDYWRQQLAGAAPFLEIPADFPRPASPTFARQSHRFEIAEEPFANISRLCREETATPFMFFMAAFQLLLSRCTGRIDILAGTDVVNRDRPETQALIGFFVNQMVMRTDLSGCGSFRELLRRVRNVALEGYANQELPFDRLVEALRPPRDSQRPPFYQVKLTYTNSAGAPLEMPGLTARSVPADKGTAQLDLTLFLSEHAGSVSGRMEYRVELFRPATAARLASDYQQIILTCAAAPDLSLDLGATPVREPKTGARERMLANRQKLLGIGRAPR